MEDKDLPILHSHVMGADDLATQGASSRNHDNDLTHLPLDKMAATLVADKSTCFSLNEKEIISILFSLKFVPRSPTYNTPA